MGFRAALAHPWARGWGGWGAYCLLGFTACQFGEAVKIEAVKVNHCLDPPSSMKKGEYTPRERGNTPQGREQYPPGPPGEGGKYPPGRQK